MPAWPANGSNVDVWDVALKAWLDNPEFVSMDWAGGNVTFVPLTGDIQTYIDNAVAGDTLILASGQYTITGTITVDKQLNIVGQGNAGFLTAPVTAGHGTLISSSTSGVVGFDITSDNVKISNLSINLTGAGSTGINSSENLTGLVLSNIDVIVICTGLAQAFTIYSSNIVLRNLTFYAESSNNVAYGFWFYNDTSTDQDAIADCFNVTGTVKGGATAAYGFLCENNEAHVLTMNLNNCYAKAINNTALDVAVASKSTGAGTNSSVVNCYLCTMDGANYDAWQNQTNQLNIGGSVLVNNLVSGTVTYRAAMASASIVSSETVTEKSDNGGLLVRQKFSELVTVAKGSSSQASSTISLPAGAIVQDVSYKVVQSIDGTSPPTNWNAFWTTKDAANHDAVVDNVGVAVAAGKSTFVASGSGGGDGSYVGPYGLPQANTLTIEMTDGADNPTIVPVDSATTFQVRVQVYYTVTTPPTS